MFIFLFHLKYPAKSCFLELLRLAMQVFLVGYQWRLLLLLDSQMQLLQACFVFEFFELSSEGYDFSNLLTCLYIHCVKYIRMIIKA